MKPTFSRKSARGITLLELSIVILVLLTLVSVLFVGARGWKKGADRSANILNIRNAQQAVRGYQNSHVLRFGEPLTEDIVYGTSGDGIGGYLRKPSPPTSAILSYQGGSVVPEIGDLWLEVDYKDATASSTYGPENLDTDSW